MRSITRRARPGSVCWRGGCAGILLGGLHGILCSLPKVNDIAIGIAMMSLGTGLAFFFGKPFIQPQAAHLPSIPLGEWTGNPKLAVALQVNPLFFVGIAAALCHGLVLP